MPVLEFIVDTFKRRIRLINLAILIVIVRESSHHKESRVGHLILALLLLEVLCEDFWLRLEGARDFFERLGLVIAKWVLAVLLVVHGAKVEVGKGFIVRHLLVILENL